MTERWSMARATIMRLGSARSGSARRSHGGAGLTTAGRRGGAGVSVADLAGAGAGDWADSAGVAAIHRPRGGEVIGAGTTTTSTGLAITATVTGPTPARIFIAIMGSLPAIVSAPRVSTAPPDKAVPATSAALTIRGRASSRPDSVRACKAFPAVSGIRAARRSSLETTRSVRIIVAGWRTPIVGACHRGRSIQPAHGLRQDSNSTAAFQTAGFKTVLSSHPT